MQDCIYWLTNAFRSFLFELEIFSIQLHFFQTNKFQKFSKWVRIAMKMHQAHRRAVLSKMKIYQSTRLWTTTRCMRYTETTLANWNELIGRKSSTSSIACNCWSIWMNVVHTACFRVGVIWFDLTFGQVVRPKYFDSACNLARQRRLFGKSPHEQDVWQY